MLSVRKLVFAGALLAVVPFAAVAQEKVVPKAEPKAMPSATTVVPGPAPVVVPGPGAAYPGAPCPPTPCPPQTMRVCKMVPTQVQETRTVMKQVQRQECYTAYREETVTEKKCVPVTTYKKVTETVMETRTRCVKVPCMEQKTVMEKRKKIEWVTETKEKCHISFKKDCVSLGGHNCCGSGGGMGGCCGGGDGCGDKGSCFNFSFPVCKPTIERECVQVCRPKCTYECVPVCKTVCTYKTETKTECVPVCKTRCVPCTENKEITVCKKVCVPYQATRCVTECVPTTECVTVCKMVPTWVEVPCPAPAPCPPAAAPCPTAAAPCGNPCDSGYGNGGGCCLFDKLSCLKCDLGNKFSGCCDNIGCHLNKFNCNLHDKFNSFNCNLHDKFSGFGGCFGGCFGGMKGGCCK